jgi:hypothetical protein
MGLAQKFGWSIVGVTTTMAMRKIASAAMHDANGEPKFSRLTRRNNSFGVMLALAVSAGVLLALGDVLNEQRKDAVEVGT